MEKGDLYWTPEITINGLESISRVWDNGVNDWINYHLGIAFENQDNCDKWIIARGIEELEYLKKAEEKNKWKI